MHDRTIERGIQRMSAACWLALSLSTGLLGACDDESTGQCTYNSDCATNELCAQGRCLAECVESIDCRTGEICIAGVCERARDGGQVGDGGRLDGGEVDRGDELPDFGPRPAGYGEIQGLVHFRLFDDTTLPVAQPIVYWNYPESPSERLPDGASCECGFPPQSVIGGADGTFILEDVPAGWVWLTVQKGNFRRSRLIEVTADERTAAPVEMTELPVRHDPDNGDEIPRIVIGTGRFDAIEDIFAKLRLGPITPTFGFDYETYMEDPEAWGVELMVYQQPREMEDNDLELVAPSFPELLNDGDRLDDYHIAFAPCAEYNTYGTLMTSAAVRANVREFVNAGGKLYVTDYAYDVLEQTFPEYIDFSAPETGDGNADNHIGDPDYTGIAAYQTLMYESDNKALDPFLASWLVTIDAAESSGKVLTSGNWVNLNGVGPGEQCCDPEGSTVDVTPDIVMSGPNGVDPFIGDFRPSHDTWEAAEAVNANYPHTVHFTYGCGQVMYSTYHTVDFQARRASLAPQELVLLWLILEIGECQLNPIKRPDE